MIETSDYGSLNTHTQVSCFIVLPFFTSWANYGEGLLAVTPRGVHCRHGTQAAVARETHGLLITAETWLEVTNLGTLPLKQYQTRVALLLLLFLLPPFPPLCRRLLLIHFLLLFFLTSMSLDKFICCNA